MKLPSTRVLGHFILFLVLTHLFKLQNKLNKNTICNAKVWYKAIFVNIKINLFQFLIKFKRIEFDYKKLYSKIIFICILIPYICTASSEIDSHQLAAKEFGVLTYLEGNPNIDSRFACTAKNCKLTTPNRTSISYITGAPSNCPANHNNICGNYIWSDSFFDATAYKGAIDPDIEEPWWEGWTISDGDASSLTDNFFHPLTDNLTRSADVIQIVPDDTLIGGEPFGYVENSLCNLKFYDDGSGFGSIIYMGDATSEGVKFPVCAIDTSKFGNVSPLTENATITNDVMWLVTTFDRGADNLQVGTGDRRGVNSNADGCDGTDDDSNISGFASATLSFEPGAQWFGVDGELAGIEITRGSSIRVMGTADLPVVMSSAEAGLKFPDNISWSSDGIGINNFTGRGEFSGLILNGCSWSNEALGKDVASEAVKPGESRFYGGSEPYDSSGEIHYLVIDESGEEFKKDKEVQGLTLEAVGAGTQIDHIHIDDSGDDGVEWFGGNVNHKYIVVTAQGDDGLDFDHGYQGLIQYALVVLGDDVGHRGIESDNFSSISPNVTPRTMPTLSNITILGSMGNFGAGLSIGQTVREGSGGFYDKLIIADRNQTTENLKWGNGCLDIDTMGAKQEAICNKELIWIQSHFNCSGGTSPEDEIFLDAQLRDDTDDSSAKCIKTGDISN